MNVTPLLQSHAWLITLTHPLWLLPGEWWRCFFFLGIMMKNTSSINDWTLNICTSVTSLLFVGQNEREDDFDQHIWRTPAGGALPIWPPLNCLIKSKLINLPLKITINLISNVLLIFQIYSQWWFMVYSSDSPEISHIIKEQMMIIPV